MHCDHVPKIRACLKNVTHGLTNVRTFLAIYQIDFKIFLGICMAKAGKVSTIRLAYPDFPKELFSEHVRLYGSLSSSSKRI